MNLDRNEIAVRVLCALVTKDGVNGYGSASDAVRAADDLLLALKPAEVAPVPPPAPTPAPVAPPAGKYEPRVGDFVTWGSCTAMWRVLRVDSGGVYAVFAEKRNYTSEPRYLDPSECETLRLATPSELAAAGFAVPPPASPTPAPDAPPYRGADCLNMIGAVVDYFGQSFIVTSHGKSQLLGFPDALASGHVTPSAITFLRWATDEERKQHRIPTPSPEAKRPTHVRVTKIADTGFDVAVGSVYEVVRWYDDGGGAVSPQVMADNGELVELAYVDHSDADYCPSWEPAPCPPPVAGSGEKDEAVRDVLAEREKQRAKWGDSHDDDHKHGELTIAAAELAVAGTDARVDNAADESDPWGLVRKHPNRRDQLVIAAALLLAEIERIDRAALSRPVRP